MKKIKLILCLFLFSYVFSLNFNRNAFVNYITKYANYTKKEGHDGCINYFDMGGNCCKLVSRGLRKAGNLKFWGMIEDKTKWYCIRAPGFDLK